MMRVEPYSGGAFAENGYLAVCEETSRAVVVDPGAAAGSMVERIRAQGLELEAIVLTHAHLDHIEGVPVVREALEAPIWLHPDDRPLYDQASAQAAAFGVSLPGDLPAPDRELRPGEPFRFGNQELEVRFTPGHAPGHVILYSAAAGLALVGDVVFAGSIGRTDLPGGNFQQLMTSIREHVLTLPEETRLLTGHGPETTVARERRENPFLVTPEGGSA